MYALAIHGGAGALPRTQLSRTREAQYHQGLLAALSAGQRVLESAGSALDAVEAAVTVLEDDELFNAGRGAVLTSDGGAELDAAIMDGRTLRAGAVAQLRHIRNPVQLARRVLEQSPHVFLVGPGAESYASELGIAAVPNAYFITAYRQEQLAALRAPRPAETVASRLATLDEPPVGTVGAVACDQHGALAAATSTGGIAGKRSGRVGDSPVIGAGTYADTQCAVSTTGHGEWFLRAVAAYDIAARLRYSDVDLKTAVIESVQQRLVQLGAAGGLIAIDAQANVVMEYNTPAMFRASVKSGEAPTAHIF